MFLQISCFQRHVAQEHIDGMKAGSVVVDLAAETGGNIETTRWEVLVLLFFGCQLFESCERFQIVDIKSLVANIESSEGF